MDCGPACLKMVAAYHGKIYSLEFLRNISYLNKQGVSLLGISEAAERIGYRTLGVQTTPEELFSEAPLPAILHWNQNHFVVIPPQRASNLRRKVVTIADPRHGIVDVDLELLKKQWMDNRESGVVLLLEPTQSFFSQDDNENKKTGFLFLFSYLRPFKRYVAQLFISILTAGFLSLLFPFLTQSLVDYGINRQDISFVYLVLLSQLLLFVGSTAIELIRNWILLHINVRININILSDFLIKLMRLPIRYFDTKQIGDIQQRLGDHQRIQNFLTGTTLNTLFSFLNLFVFAIVLIFYSWKILGLFVVFSAASIIWILFFLKKRKELDYKRFQRMSDNQNMIFELITGMQEIKLNNCETSKRWEWERIQARLYRIGIKGLVLGQSQQIGASIFNQLKNILISFVSAVAVMKGEMTLGMMLSVSYIIGQMNGPLDQLLTFVQGAQDAKISLDRLSEIHSRPNEDITTEESAINWQEFQGFGDIKLSNVSFQYEGPHSPYVLRDINLTIPKGKVTAIVGSSGSGKTTLMKLLLQYYEPVKGNITVGKIDFKEVPASYWRSKVGTVVQEGLVFSDTISRNIAISDEKTDYSKLEHAATVANIKSFIEELPLGYQTKIGNTGTGISTGQKQRFQIARAVYKNPEYLFFDEATSALDANNERVIMENLDVFFKGKTVVIIAHRLSTVMNADQIIVLDHGSIVESGTHEELSIQKGYYYSLVKNQLELGT